MNKQSLSERARTALHEGIPMPLWLQGAFELLQSAIISALLVVIPLVAVWFAGGFEDLALDNLFRLCGQAWLLMHGVPLQMSIPDDGGAALTGTLSLTPLGLALVPFLLSWRAGRRIARASYTDQLWQGLAGALGAYALFGLFTGFAVPTDEVAVPLTAAGLIPLVVAGAGVVIGCRREAGSWARLVGVDLVDWIATTSQHARWAGSYAWAVIRASVLGYFAALALASLVLAISLGAHWAEMSNVYQQLGTGVIGGILLTVGQLGLIPNFAFYALAWISGGGFSLGVGSTLSTLETTVGPLPAVPLLAALPTGDVLASAWMLMALPVVGGFLAGWWFVREGEDHLDDWCALKVPYRWLSLALSTLLLGAFVGAGAGVVSMVGSWISMGSIGLGRLTEIGPDLWMTAAFVGAEVAVGTMLGSLSGPLLVPDPVLDDDSRRR
ncbi:cell division protein PerM [Zhihengliuella salsuginis]|uniref:Integral membrane protein n=1 Tax=Zhihengliuella salsuginis TaxID=578222 RepID=A0ABQ3GKI7_9MICC|nr:DUF6350 family protein [Zhihengliuella salsuginis]GHD09200.1 hypothetical protein GCM10008096_21620 [Zhihengliuella salsuginis]